jgi:hypothetical protein
MAGTTMKFIYFDSDKGIEQEIEVNIKGIKVNDITYKPLTNNTLQSEPGYYSHSWQSCNWNIVEGDNKTPLFHERYFTSWMKKPFVQYWLTDCDFKNPEEACIEIVKRGCNPDLFHAQQHFYTQYDGEGCFIITSSFDEALKFYGYKFEPTEEELKTKEATDA